jgi:prefoldin subunit 5
LNQKLNEKDAEIQDLKRKLDELQAVVTQLAAQK